MTAKNPMQLTANYPPLAVPAYSVFTCHSAFSEKIILEESVC